MYDNYVFDLYGTLVDIHTDEEQDILWEKMAMFYGYQGAYYTKEDLHDTFYAIIHQMEQEQRKIMEKDRVQSGCMYAHEAFPEIQIEYVFRELYNKKNIEKSLEFSIVTGEFFRALSTEYVRTYEGVKELFLAMKNKNKKIYLLSNAQRAFTEYELKGLDVFQYFDGIMISSDCGTKKPDARFFEMLIERYDLDVKRSIMIGNDMSTDIEGAKKVGMDTFYIHSNLSPDLIHEPKADYVLKDMDLKRVRQMLEL